MNSNRQTWDLNLDVTKVMSLLDFDQDWSLTEFDNFSNNYKHQLQLLKASDAEQGWLKNPDDNLFRVKKNKVVEKKQGFLL